MSAKRDKTQGFAFVLTDDKHALINEVVANSNIYKQFMAKNKDTTAALSDVEASEELEIIAADVVRHLHDGVSAATVITWAAEDLTKLYKKVSK